MTKNVVMAGLLGAVVLMLSAILVDGIFGFRARINMRPLAEERQVYDVLRAHVTTPGRYAVNPALTAEGRFPADEPAFSVMYGGVGHEAAGGLMLVGLAVALLTPLLAAWMLSQASPRVLASYPRKVACFVAFGGLLALVGDLSDFGIGGYPTTDALLLAGRSVVDWTLVGLVVSWRIGPEPLGEG